MIPRYQDPKITHVFSDENRLRRWWGIELRVLKEQARLGIVPQADADAILKLEAPAVKHDTDWSIVADQIAHIESAVKHDVDAFVRYMGAWYGEPGQRWLHFGLTSSDIVDTGLALLITEAWDHIGSSILGTIEELRTLQKRCSGWTWGRTHGQPAAPMTMYHRVDAWAHTLQRAAGLLHSQVTRARVGKISGPVGEPNRDVLPIELEQAVLDRLGLGTGQGHTQIIPRDLHVGVMFGLATVANACAGIATDLRLLTMTGEATVPFVEGQVGSSSMPHKRNPIDCEKIAGLARLCRGYLLAEMESTELWLERDISHSSVERVVLPDSMHTVCHALVVLRGVIERTELRPYVGPAPAIDTYDRTIAGIRSGLTRDQARSASLE